MKTATSIWNFAAIATLALVSAGSVGCATAQKQVKTPRYALTYPDYWELKGEGQQDGQATTVIIKEYGSAIIDEGSGAMTSKDQNYEAVQADVEVRIYGWPEPEGVTNPSMAVRHLLLKDSDLQLASHGLVPEQPVECGRLRKKYTILGSPQDPLDIVRRPGWRAIVVGGKASGVLVGVVARVPNEQQDGGLYCHNLGRMQVQIQNLLDGLSVVPAAPGGATPAPSAPAPAPAEGTPPAEPPPPPAPAAPASP